VTDTRPPAHDIPASAVASLLLRRIRRALAAEGSPARAAGARAYMKSAMPFHGVDAATLRGVCRRVFAAWPLSDEASWRREALALWRGARFREERYAAIELTGVKAAGAWQTPAALPMYEEMIVTGAWWDYVDWIASRRIGLLLARHPGRMRHVLRRWADGDDLWKRRAAMLSQLTFKTSTDADLLYACILPSIDSPEFFLRKGIGWALRQYARTNPSAVRCFVDQHRDRLSALSVREATRHLVLE
jgi:3-methyladenine DNA glycosylase AlkD